MGISTYLGVALVLIGGAMEGSFALPLKYARRWNWENTWGAGSLFALLLVPWPIAYLSFHNLFDVYTAASWKSLLVVFAFGCGWGAGGVFFGLGVSALGLSVGVSLIMAINAVVGSVIPLVIQHPDQFGRPAGLALSAGVAVMIAGVGLCGAAGMAKERGSAMPGETHRAKKTSFRLGIVICVISAILSALVNFGLIFGAEIRNAALQQGASLTRANNVLWAPVFTGNYLVNIAYCAFLVQRRKSLKQFFQAGAARYWVWAVFMGLVWGGGIIVYGTGVSLLGQFGAFLGFPVMLIGSILAANALGALAGEWSGASPRAKHMMVAGVCILIVAVCVLAYSNQLIS